MEWFLLVLAVLILLGLALWWLSSRGDTAPGERPSSESSIVADIDPAAVDEPVDDDTTETSDAAEVAAAEPAGDDGEPYGPGTAVPRADGSGPEGWTVKGDEETMLYHTEESPYYRRTTAAVWFESEEAAQAAGFTRWRQR